MRWGVELGGQVPYPVSENGTGHVYFPITPQRNVTPVNVGTAVVKVMFDAATKCLTTAASRLSDTIRLAGLVRRTCALQLK